MVNTRTFSANIGDASTGNAGPDAIETDIDNLLANDQELLGITGDKTTLTTDVKTTLVAAINEHETQINGKAETSHSHGNVTSAGAIGTTADIIVKKATSGALTTLTAGTTSQFLRGDGTWQEVTMTDAPSVDGKSVWVGAEGSKGTDANTLYFCY